MQCRRTDALNFVAHRHGRWSPATLPEPEPRVMPLGSYCDAANGRRARRLGSLLFIGELPSMFAGVEQWDGRRVSTLWPSRSPPP